MADYKGAAAEATRAMNLMKKRQKAVEELEFKKRKIEEDSMKLTNIDNKFSAHKDSIDNQIKSSTVGLVTLDQLRERHEIAEKERDREMARNNPDQQGSSQGRLQLATGEKKNSIIKKAKKLSFGYDSDEDDEEETGGKDKDCDKKDDCNKDDKNCQDADQTKPKTKCETESESRLHSIAKLDVDTSLLPDCEREEEERRMREKLADEWREAQQRLKCEEIEITFSFWDGSGHRRQVKMKKGDSIYQFLQACLETLRKDFNELRKVSADQLMYVKEDLIIPHHYTFYDFIVTKARGKSGPLFSFDVHDDIRLMGDARVEKDESHAGKVLLRSWYERNKHIFPASRWEPYDPTKSYSKYTISDKRSK